MARWISAAATEESTPPESPRITSSSPTCSRMRAIASDDVVGHVPVAGAAADVVDEAPEDRRALHRVRDLGMELHRVEAARFVGHGGDRAGVGRGHELEAGGHFA